MLNVLDLFSGIGGFSLGLEATGRFKTIAFCEMDAAAQRVLNHHWPEVPIYGDVRTLSKKDIQEEVDVICGGFPCQDISAAGKQQGIIGERSGLWSEFFRLIQEFKPKYAIIENVSALRSQGLALVLQNLSEIGYDAEWNCIPASAIGASHQRDRIWILAYPRSRRLHEQGEGEDQQQGRTAIECGSPAMAYSISKGPQGGLSGRQDAEWEGFYRCLGRYLSSPKTRWVALPNESPPCTEPPRTTPTQPRIRRSLDGVPSRMDRIKQLGNAVVPQIPELLGKAILEREYEESNRNCCTAGAECLR